MATRNWLGRAKAVAQVSTVTIGGTIEADDVFTLTINGKTLSVVAGSTSADTVRSSIVSAWNDVTDSEFTEITAANGSGTGELTLTGDTAGLPFTVTVDSTEDGGGAKDAQTISISETIAATGPNHWSDASNWSGGAVPVDSDAVVISTAIAILYGLAQSAVTLASLKVSAAFTATIGLPKTNANGYTEYRDDYLNISATVLQIGTGEGSGSGRIKINLGSAQTTAEVRTTGSGLDTDVPAVLLLGTHASNALDVSSGSVGVAIYPEEVSTLSVLKTTRDAEFESGSGVTLGAATSGGQTRIDSAATTVTVTAGSDTQITGSGAVTNLNVGRTGRCRYESSGTVTNVSNAGDIDCTGDTSARTFTNTTLKPGGRIIDPQGTITHTNKIALSSDVIQIQAA